MENVRLRPSDLFLNLAKECEAGDLTLASLVNQMGVRSHALIVLLFSMPFVAFLPLPGLSIILGALIMFCGLAITLNIPIWLPGFIGRKKLKSGMTAKIIAVAAKILKKVEFLFKPRLQFITENRILTAVLGLVIIASGFILLLPLPPGTNFPPAVVLAILSVGLLEKDGIAAVVGVAIFALEVLVLLLVYFQVANLVTS